MAVAAANALRDLSGKDVLIKWVNDLYLDGRKISGILTECSSQIKNGRPSFVVTGIGINILKPEGGFPDDIKDRAGALLDKIPEAFRDITEFKRALANAIISSFEKMYKDFPGTDFVDEYRDLCMLTGRDVVILNGPKVRVLGIEDDLGLKVMHEDKSVEVLHAGEISIIL